MKLARSNFWNWVWNQNQGFNFFKESKLNRNLDLEFFKTIIKEIETKIEKMTKIGN